MFAIILMIYLALNDAEELMDQEDEDKSMEMDRMNNKPKWGHFFFFSI